MAMIYPLKACPVCGEMHRRKFSLCGNHEHRLRKYGDVHGRVVRAVDLKPYRLIAKGLLQKYQAERAVIAGHKVVMTIMTDHGLDDMAHAVAGRKARPHLDNLLAAGATARTALTELLALALYWECGNHMVSAREMQHMMALRLLTHRRLQKGGPRPSQLGSQVLRGLGYRLSENLLTLMISMAKHYLASVKAYEAQKVELMSFAPTF